MTMMVKVGLRQFRAALQSVEDAVDLSDLDPDEEHPDGMDTDDDDEGAP